MCGYGAQERPVSSQKLVCTYFTGLTRIRIRMRKYVQRTRIPYHQLNYYASNFKVAEASKKIWTSGCIEVVRLWAERNLYTIGAVALGVALSQVNRNRHSYNMYAVTVL